jgi:hypothetical protein
MELSVGKYICMDFNRYLKELEKQKRCVFLPFEIKSINLKNINKYVEKNVEFSRYNILYGNIGGGKSTIIKSIRGFTGVEGLLRDNQTSGEINLITSDSKRYHLDVYSSGVTKCLAVDNGGERLDTSCYNDFLYYLRHLDVQLILTIENMNIDRKELLDRAFPDCRFIQLN